MAFLVKDDLGQDIYDEILTGITRGDDKKITEAIDEAVDEVTGYLCGRYDTDDLFTKEADERNKTVLSICRTLAIYNLHSACHNMTELRRTEYEDAISLLGKIQSGKFLLKGAKLEGETEEIIPDQQVSMTSNPKRNNQF